MRCRPVFREQTGIASARAEAAGTFGAPLVIWHLPQPAVGSDRHSCEKSFRR
jgi:hypothetical protein